MMLIKGLLNISNSPQTLKQLFGRIEFSSIVSYFYYSLFSDADFRLAPFFDGYDRKRLDEHEKELNVCLFFLSLYFVDDCRFQCSVS